MDKIMQEVAKLGKKYGARRVVLYGSRARGDFRENSDYDIAVYGMPEGNRGSFWADVEELPTLLDFDIAHITGRSSAAFVENIAREGVVLMDKFTEKYGKLCSAVKRLEEAIATYERTELEEVRDGVIQRFEFCTELAWKTLREKLIDEGYTQIDSPKSVMKQAFAAGLLEDGQAWLTLLNDRNLTSHIYEEETAAEIFQRIKETHLQLFQAIVKRLK